MNTFKRISFILLNLLCGLFPLLVYSQEPDFNSDLYKNEIRNTFAFRISGQIEVQTQKDLVLDLSLRQQLFLDFEFLKAVDLEQLKEVKEKTKEMVAQAKKLRQERARAQGKKKRQEVTQEWNEYLKEFDSEMDRLLQPKEKEIFNDMAMATEFFQLGVVEFLKKHSTSPESAGNFDDESIDEIEQEIVKIEKEVWKLLLKSLDTDRLPEFELALNDGLPGRSPSLSVLWQSLWSLENGAESSSNNSRKLPVFAVRAGRLKPVSHRPYPAGDDLMRVLVMTSRGHPDQELVDDCIQEMFTAQFAIQKKYQSKRSGSLYDMERIKQLNRERVEEQAKSRNQFFDELPERVKNRVGRAKITADYQRHGIEAAWFSPENRELMEFPPDENDLARLKENAKEAREHLEERVQKLFRKFVLAHLSSHFEPDSINIRWVHRNYPLQIPPIELLGVERPKGDFR